MSARVALVVLDGVGCGEAHDAAAYGDVGSNTLAHVLEQVPTLMLPTMQLLGLGHVATLRGVSPVEAPAGAVTVLQPRGAGKDSTTGHWELAGLVLDTAFPTFPDGFPDDLLQRFAHATGRGVIGNCVASGTVILEALGAQHVATGSWIVYTSADSVFQVAAHEQVVPLDELYRACGIARELLSGAVTVSRVIARPFTGTDGDWQRTTNRRDYSVAPVGDTLLDVLERAGVSRAGVGKVDDLFASRGIVSQHTPDNAAGMTLIREWLEGPTDGFLFANLVDFDQQFGHRNDVAGFAGALAQFDAALPSLLGAMHDDDLLFITADHGNDPTTATTDHARERVPLLLAGRSIRSVVLPERDTFADVGATVAAVFGLDWRGNGTSFLPEVRAA